jgi:hypothetical protein
VSGGAHAGGGGAGGALLLESPTITIQGIVAANGASGGNQPLPIAGEYGYPGTPNATAATNPIAGGGSGSAGPTINGGNGALLNADAGIMGTPSGGGGAGWIRLNTGCLTVATNAIISPSQGTMCTTNAPLKLH